MNEDADCRQRYLTAPSVRDAQRALWLKLLVLPFFHPLAYICGIALYSFYHSGGRLEPVSSGLVQSADQIMPFFATTEVPVGLAGMLVSGILAATMSTTSSGLTSVSTAIVTDFILRLGWVSPTSSVAARLALSRRAMLCSSGAMILSAFLVSRLGTQIAELAWIINGLVGGPLLGVFLLGMLTRTAEGIGALVGVVCGSVALLVVMASKRGCTDGACVGGCCDTWLGSLGAVAFFFCESHGPTCIFCLDQ